VATILNHEPRLHQGPRLWMFAGTGEGPRLAAQLLQAGWSLRVSVVSPIAALAYRPLLADAPLELQIGALGGAAALAGQLQQAASQGFPFAALIDATHPFATQVSRSLQQACRQQRQLLLRLEREPLSSAGATLLAGLTELRDLDLTGERLLLAIGGRHLAQAVAGSPGALHHARVLPAAPALQWAQAAGLSADRIACLRPGPGFVVEQALVRRWQISTILCRQSGGLTEAGWRRVAARQGCRLLLLARPAVEAAPDPDQAPLSMQALLARLESLHQTCGGASNNSDR
jgi:precorrin-6A/cobalt-precorrin-6A reductase